jgi:cation transport regulator ChaC
MQEIERVVGRDVGERWRHRFDDFGERRAACPPMSRTMSAAMTRWRGTVKSGGKAVTIGDSIA